MTHRSNPHPLTNAALQRASALAGVVRAPIAQVVIIVVVLLITSLTGAG